MSRREKPKRIQLSREKGWKLPAGAVSVARPGPWGNPFTVGEHGDQAGCVLKYRRLLAGGTYNSPAVEVQAKARDHVLHHLDELRGKTLACWCPLPTRGEDCCHAAVLLDLANEPDKEPTQ